MRVKLQQNIFRLWIIVSSENDRLAWGASNWVPIDRDGLPTTDLKTLTFATVTEAISYAESVGLEVEHGSAHH